jgi:deoxyribonuclease V
VAVLDAGTLECIESTCIDVEIRFPYIPGLLSFREGPAVIAALDRLRTVPDLLIIDGQGLAHPRRFGLACHIGVYTGLPAIGCAKSRLCGTHRMPGRKRGARAVLKDRGDVIGAVVRTRTGVKPVYVSIGHRIDLETGIAWVLRCCTWYRLPETTRQAHRLASP